MKTISYLFALIVLISACSQGEKQTTEVETKAAEPTSYNHLALGTLDTEGMAKWYERVLGARIVQQFGSGQRQISVDGKYWQLMPIDSAQIGAENTGGLFKIGFRTQGLESLRDSLMEMGVSVHGDLMYDENLDEHTFIILDPDGNRLQFFGTKEGQPANLEWMFAAMRIPKLEGQYGFITETLGFSEIYSHDQDDPRLKIRLVQRDDMLLEIIEDQTVSAPGSSAKGFWGFTVNNIAGSTAEGPMSESISFFHQDSE